MGHNWPSTKLAVSALLPNAFIDVSGLNSQYQDVAASRGAEFFDCGDGLDPESSQYLDGTHLSTEGERVWLECMRGAVAGLLGDDDGTDDVADTSDDVVDDSTNADVADGETTDNATNEVTGEATDEDTKDTAEEGSA